MKTNLGTVSTVDINGGTIDGSIIGGAAAAAATVTALTANTSFVLNGSTALTSVDIDLSTVSAADDTLATAKAIKTYIDSQVTAQDLDFIGDSGGALAIDLDSEVLTIAGGTGIDTSGAANTLTVAIDSTVATLAGTQTLTNKTIGASTLSGTVTGGGNDMVKMGTISLTEQAAANVDVAGDGQVWVKTATPNVVMFTDDAGTDFQLASLAGTETLTNKSIDLANNTLTTTSLQLKTALTDETGSGAAVFATSPILVTPCSRHPL
jgi:hypothetical protein